MPKKADRLDEALSLRATLAAGCVAMARYALAAGKAIPPQVAQAAEAAGADYGQARGGLTAQEATAEGERKDERSEPDGEPNGSSSKLEMADIKALAAVHDTLARIVAPATPQAIMLIAAHKGERGLLSFLGPVPLVRRMMFAAIACLALFIWMASFEDVTGDIAVVTGHGMPLLRNIAFLLAAAGLGACFAAMFQANRFVVEANYDPKFEPSYWIRFTLGLMAGIILAELVGDALVAGQGVDPEKLTRPVLALLGGFSAALVYRVLNRLVAAVDSIFRGETREIVAAQEQTAKARLAEQGAQDRMETIARLVALQQQLTAGASSDELKRHLSGILSDYLGTDLSAAASAEAKREEPAPAEVTSIAERG